jgi:XTP/dITP diphosphohydrolase
VKRLVIATRNPGKAREISRILSGLDYEVRSLADYPPTPEPEENAGTFVGNATIKALAAAEQTGELSLADDSGLAVDALDGAPGVYSSRFAGEGATDEERCRKLLDLMKHVPDEKRTARFIATIAIAEPGCLIDTVEDTCEGIIAREPKGENGFGYDPVFFVPKFSATMAELPPEVKNRISHRAKALEAAKAILKRKP